MVKATCIYKTKLCYEIFMNICKSMVWLTLTLITLSLLSFGELGLSHLAKSLNSKTHTCTIYLLKLKHKNNTLNKKLCDFISFLRLVLYCPCKCNHVAYIVTICPNI